MSTTWTTQAKPGGAWTYNASGVDYNEAGYLYNSLGAETVWTPQTKN